MADRQTKSQSVTSPGPNPADRTTPQRHSFLPVTRPASRPLRPKTSSRFPEQAPGLPHAGRKHRLDAQGCAHTAIAVSWDTSLRQKRIVRRAGRTTPGPVHLVRQDCPQQHKLAHATEGNVRVVLGLLQDAET